MCNLDCRYLCIVYWTWRSVLWFCPYFATLDSLQEVRWGAQRWTPRNGRSWIAIVDNGTYRYPTGLYVKHSFRMLQTSFVVDRMCTIQSPKVHDWWFYILYRNMPIGYWTCCEEELDENLWPLGCATVQKVGWNRSPNQRVRFILWSWPYGLLYIVRIISQQYNFL